MIDRETLLRSRIRLHNNVRTRLQQYRSENWFLLDDPLSSNQLLLDEPSFEFLKQLQHAESVADVIESGDTHDNLDAAAQFIAKLFAAGFLVTNSSPTPTGKIRRWLTPFAIKVPLLDPHNLLNRLYRATRSLFSGWGVLLLFLVGTYALLILASGWGSLVYHWQTRFMDPGNLFLVLMLYPLIKVLHEIGHGLTARHWGAEIHEMGVMLLVFLPVPYVDASATSSFPEPGKRMLVAAAGIIAELLIASLGLIAWSMLPDGTLRDVGFNVAVIAGVSTVFFNGNPLLRFDGYYVLMDFLEVPNLGTRSSAYLRWLFLSRMCGLAVTNPARQPGEPAILLVYGILSSVYRLLIGLTIAAYLAGRFFLFGLLLAVWLLGQQLVLPLIKLARDAARLMQRDQMIVRPVILAVTAFFVLPAALLFVPLSHHTTTFGIVMPPQEAMMRVATPGFVTSTMPMNGTQLAEGESIVILENLELRQEQITLLARIKERELEQRSAFLNNPGESQRLAEEIVNLKLELQQLTGDLEALALVANQSGRFSSLMKDNPTGRFLERGTLVGVLVQPGSRTAQVLLPQHKIHLISENVRNIRAITFSEPSRPFSGTLVATTPQAVRDLPHDALGSASGGPIPVDATDDRGLRLLEPMFQLQLTLEGAQPLIGQRLIVRFRHEASPLGARLWQSAANEINEILKR